MNTKTEKEDLTDVEDVVMFIDQFVRNKQKSIQRISLVLSQKTGLLNEDGDDLFTHDFTPLYDMMGGAVDGQKIFEDMLHVVFRTTTLADEPRLHMEHLRQTDEIALKVGDDGRQFGVISIGDAPKLMKLCEERKVVVSSDPISNHSLFANINRSGSDVNVLIGSRKFTEGWNSWRVSTIGLINFAKGEGSQAIQMFGRGVRLKGYQGLLKRSHALSSSVHAPQVKHINKLETLTLFGVKANYMAEFKKFLEMEGAPSNDKVTEVNLPVVSRYETVKKKRLRVIRVRSDKNFKRVPEENIAVLDYQYLYDELQEYKNEKAYFNLSIQKDSLEKILGDREWYEFIIPRQHLEIDSMQKLQNMNEFCLMALKAYVEKYYKFEKERWEDQYLEYAELEEDDNNFIKDNCYHMSLIKELEARLAPSSGDKRIVLNSFIMSATKAAQLKQWWHMQPADYEAMNVYTLDDSRCVEKMLEKLEIQVAT